MDYVDSLHGQTQRNEGNWDTNILGVISFVHACPSLLRVFREAPKLFTDISVVEDSLEWSTTTI